MQHYNNNTVMADSFTLFFLKRGFFPMLSYDFNNANICLLRNILRPLAFIYTEEKEGRPRGVR